MVATATVSDAGSGPASFGVLSRTKTPGVLVTGADYRGFGVVRSLGRRGIPAWLIKEGGHLVAATSRYVRQRVAWPPGEDSRKIEFLLDLATRHHLDGWMLLPTSDYTVALI